MKKWKGSPEFSTCDPRCADIMENDGKRRKTTETPGRGFHLPLISALVMKVKGGIRKISGTFSTCRHIMRSDMMKSGKILRTFSADRHIAPQNMEQGLPFASYISPRDESQGGPRNNRQLKAVWSETEHRFQLSG